MPMMMKLEDWKQAQRERARSQGKVITPRGTTHLIASSLGPGPESTLANTAPRPIWRVSWMLGAEGSEASTLIQADNASQARLLAEGKFPEMGRARKAVRVK